MGFYSLRRTRIRSPRLILLALGLGIVLGTHFVHAAILVAEPFNNYAAGSIGGQAAQGTGLSGNWNLNITGTADATIVGNLTFGANYPTSGSALQNSAVATGSNQFVIADINTTAVIGTVTGTLYSSYLIRPSSLLSGNPAVFTHRVNTTQGGLTSTSRLNTAGDSLNSSALPGIDYTGNSPSTGGNALTANNTFLVIGRFTNVGVAGGGTGTLWVLSQAQFDNLIATGGITEARLDDTVNLPQGTGDTQIWARVTNSDSAQANFVGGSSTFLQFSVATNTAASGTLTVQYDELHYATTFAEVVPEPSTTALLLASFPLLLRRSRKQ